MARMLLRIDAHLAPAVMSTIANPNASEPTATRQPSAEIRGDDRRDYIAWIPILVPALAVLVATCAYLIGWGVLAS